MTDAGVPPTAAASRLLARASAGDDRAVEQLLPLVYDELRRLAGAYLRRERPGQTLQATALVHEAYVRLIRDQGQPWHDRAHFVGIAARSMRQILVERARRRRAAKRWGGQERITLDERVLGVAAPDGGVDLVALDAALERLAVLDPQQARIVELRYFGGLTVEDTATALDISPATVKRHWTVARAWLRRALTDAR
jgi:RNA polymerase sigma-70 factor (ECF subfamily)